MEQVIVNEPIRMAMTLTPSTIQEVKSGLVDKLAKFEQVPITDDVLKEITTDHLKGRTGCMI